MKIRKKEEKSFFFGAVVVAAGQVYLVFFFLLLLLETPSTRTLDQEGGAPSWKKKKSRLACRVDKTLIRIMPGWRREIKKNIFLYWFSLMGRNEDLKKVEFDPDTTSGPPSTSVAKTTNTRVPPRNFSWSAPPYLTGGSLSLQVQFFFFFFNILTFRLCNSSLK